MIELSAPAALDKTAALAMLEEAFQQIQCANAGTPALPFDGETLKALWQNSDLTVLGARKTTNRRFFLPFEKHDHFPRQRLGTNHTENST